MIWKLFEKFLIFHRNQRLEKALNISNLATSKIKWAKKKDYNQ